MTLATLTYTQTRKFRAACRELGIDGINATERDFDAFDISDSGKPSQRRTNEISRLLWLAGLRGFMAFEYGLGNRPKWAK